MPCFMCYYSKYDSCEIESGNKGENVTDIMVGMTENRVTDNDKFQWIIGISNEMGNISILRMYCT